MAVDPLAAAVTAPADLSALVATELAQLAADAQALSALLLVDAVVTARVLPSNGFTDLLEIAGRRVAASLPPTVRPGDVLQVRVAGFDGERVLLQIVATGADAAVESPPYPTTAAQPAPAIPGTPAPPAPPAGGPPPAVSAGPAGPAPGISTSSAGAAPAASSAPSPAANPLAGSARGGPAPASSGVSQPPPPAAPPSRPGLGTVFSSVGSRAAVAPTQLPAEPAVPSQAAPQRTVVVAPGEPTSIETRLATARAAVEQRVVGGGMRGFVAPPPIAPKASAAPAAPAPAPVPAAPATRVSTPAAYAEPVALLRALRLPVTPSNVASATLALQRPDRLPDALAALERALPRASDDPNVATLRTLLAFVGRIDPRSPALATQIAAYVDHVVDGAEPKLATLLAASRAAAPPPDPATPAQAGNAAPADPRPALPAALAAERAAAVGADLKQTILAVAANPETPHGLAPALAGALTALTALQVGAAQTLAAHPDGLAFTIPLTTPHGVSNAQITVKRDAPDGRSVAAVDPENFRIAFVLETAHYGTVAIDLVTVGRDVTVDVRTEAAPAMRAFRDALGGLTARLESLRYRVASAGASLGTTTTVAVEAPPARPLDPDAAVDRSA